MGTLRRTCAVQLVNARPELERYELFFPNGKPRDHPLLDRRSAQPMLYDKLRVAGSSAA